MTSWSRQSVSPRRLTRQASRLPRPVRERQAVERLVVGRVGGDPPWSTKSTRSQRSSRAGCSERRTAARARRRGRAASRRPSGSSCEVGSSRRSSDGSRASTEARHTRWSSPAESVLGPAFGQPLGTHLGERLRTRGQISPGGGPDVLEPEGDLVRDPAEDDLVLGILEASRPRRRGRQGGRRVSRPATTTRPSNRPPKVRDEPRERAEKSRLAGAGRAQQRNDLAGLDLERDVRQRGLPEPPGYE